MHKWLASAAILALLLPAFADAQGGRGGGRGAGPGAQGGRGGGPPRPVAGNGVEVPGWWARLDDPKERTKGLKFVEMGSGLHATTGPTAIFWDPQDEASGQYTVKG